MAPVESIRSSTPEEYELSREKFVSISGELKTINPDFEQAISMLETRGVVSVDFSEPEQVRLAKQKPNAYAEAMVFYLNVQKLVQFSVGNTWIKETKTLVIGKR